MTSTTKSRKRNAIAIINKVSNLDNEYSNYERRLDDSVDKLFGTDQEDYANRENMQDYVHLYTDTFAELSILNRYKWNEKNDARLFFDNTTIKLSRYLPGWSEFKSGEKTLVDNSYLWKVFNPYSSGRDNQKINKLTLWNSDDLTPQSQAKGVPTIPSVNDFKNCIVPLDEKSSTVALDMVSECNKISSTFLNGESVKNYYYNYSKLDIGQFKFETSQDQKSFLKYNTVDFGAKDYLISAHAKNKVSGLYPENFVDHIMGVKKDGSNPCFGIFKEGTTHLFTQIENGNITAFGLGTVASAVKRADRKSLKPGYSPSGPGYPDSMIESSDFYWNCDYYADITFNFLYIKGSGELKLTDPNANQIIFLIQNYHSGLKDYLKKAQKAYNSSLETIKTSDNGKYDEYIKYLENGNYSNLHNAILMNNTVKNSVFNWINTRINDLFKSVKDDFAAETINSIIADRINKTSGSLYSWYAYDSVPLAEAYDTYKSKIKNGLYMFKTMLVAENAALDYTMEQNGGKELHKPNFFDIPASRYKYYRMAGKNTDFNVGDTVYIFDNDNAEITARIIGSNIWVGNNGSEDIRLKRLTLNTTIPDIYDYNSLKIVKLL